mgnify:CR=1 FL=1
MEATPGPTVEEAAEASQRTPEEPLAELVDPRLGARRTADGATDAGAQGEQAQPQDAPAPPDIAATPPAQEAAPDAAAAGGDPETAQAEKVLAAAGPLGVVLTKLAEVLITDSDRYKPKDKIRMVDGRTVVLRWPQAVRDVAGPDLPALAKYLAENTGLLAASMKGQTFDYAQFGIAVALRISGTPWNVVGLNEELSDAFQVVSKRNRPPSNDELPA